MKKIRSSILAGLASIALLLPSLQEKDLKEIAKPHLGVYECKQATLGSRDLLKSFSDVRLELRDEENCVLLYKEKTGKRRKWEGKYLYDREAGQLTLIDGKSGAKKSFPLTDGKLTVSFPVGKKRVVLRFEQQ